MVAEAKFSVGRVTRFYVPLLLQGFSQSLSYPLVAGVVTHGPHGVHALTAFSQGLMIMFMIGALGGGLVTTGLIFAKTRFGYLSFKRLNAMMMGALLLLQCLPAVPPLKDFVFEGFFGLPPDLADVSAQTLLWGVVMNAGFFVRNVPMVVLFNNLESAKANNATLLRIAVTLLLSLVLTKTGLVGPLWGLAALTVGVWTETLVTYLYARAFVREIPGDVPDAPHAPGLSIAALTLEQFRFTLPLALGGFLLASAPLVIAAFVARSANASDMLAVHYVAIGVANPVAFAALRLQTVSVKFQPEYLGDRRLLWYAIAAGLLLGLIPLLFATPLVGRLYFGAFQNVPGHILPTARLAVGIYALIAVFQAVRAYLEGLAAARKMSKALMLGQIGYTVSLFLVCATLLPLRVPGWAMAVSAIFVAPMCVSLVVGTCLGLAKGGRGAF